jgi:hypothetical protein
MKSTPDLLRHNSSMDDNAKINGTIEL